MDTFHKLRGERRLWNEIQLRLISSSKTEIDIFSKNDLQLNSTLFITSKNKVLNFFLLTPLFIFTTSIDFLIEGAKFVGPPRRIFGVISLYALNTSWKFWQGAYI